MISVIIVQQLSSVTSPKWVFSCNFAIKWKYCHFSFTFCLWKNRVQVCSYTIFTYNFIHIISNIIVKNGTWASLRSMFPNWKTIGQHPFLHQNTNSQNMTIFMTSFLHYDVTVGDNLLQTYVLWYQLITNLIFKACYRTLILGARNVQYRISPLQLT